MTQPLTQSPAWQALARHQKIMAQVTLADIVHGDARRLESCRCAVEGISLDYALHNVTSETMPLLLGLARQQGLEAMRDAMFRGGAINLTENRAVLHTALRQQDNAPLMLDGHDVIKDVRAAQARMRECVETIRAGRWLGATGKPIRYIVNIGIGGSDLGPRFAVQALDAFTGALDVRFVANADAYDLISSLRSCDPEATLFIVVSKTFTTQETLMNAHSARGWLEQKLGRDDLSRHFIAVSAHGDEVRKFGIPEAQMFPMWDWVGGRYSLWSAVGLPLALAIGWDNFEKLLAGAAAMDAHFRTAPLEQNMPVLLAMLGVWQRNFWDRRALAVLSYSERLRAFPRYLQQLEMESNGKSVTRDGQFTDYGTAPVIFGECGTVGQHSFHQLLHQGSVIVPVDFIGVADDDLNQPEHHRTLIANMVAQAGAFAFGQPKAATPHDIYAGNRPSAVIVLERLDPYHLGLLLALYEHKTFVQGVIWDINSFDQPGVELGKRLARGLQNPSAVAGQGVDEGFLTKFLDKNFPELKKHI